MMMMMMIERVLFGRFDVDDMGIKTMLSRTAAGKPAEREDERGESKGPELYKRPEIKVSIIKICNKGSASFSSQTLIIFNLGSVFRHNFHAGPGFSLNGPGDRTADPGGTRELK